MRYATPAAVALTSVALAAPAFAQVTLDQSVLDRVDAAGTRNEQAVLPSLQNLIPANNPQVNQLVTNINQSTGVGTRQLFDSLTGESYGSTATASSTTGAAGSRAAMTRLEEIRRPGAAGGASTIAFNTGRNDWAWLPEDDLFAQADAMGPGDTASDAAALPEDTPLNSFPDGGVWARVYGVVGDIDESTNASGIEYSGGGVVIGVDQRIADQFVIGISAGYARIDSDFDRLNEDDEADAYSLSLYGTYLITEDAWVDALLGYTFTQHDLVRNGPSGTTPAADFNSHSLRAVIEGGYNFDLNEPGTLQIQPLASLSYAVLWQEGFTESGGGPFNLDVSDVERSSLRAGIGARLLYEWSVNDSLLLLPEARAGYQHEFLDDNTQVSANFANTGSGSSFVIENVDVERDYWTIGAGLTAHTDRNISAFVGYDFAFNSNITEHVLTAGLRYAW